VFRRDFDALLIPKQRRFDTKIVAGGANVARDRAFLQEIWWGALAPRQYARTRYRDNQDTRNKPEKAEVMQETPLKQ
jgi:hypothetical protein